MAERAGSEAAWRQTRVRFAVTGQLGFGGPGRSWKEAMVTVELSPELEAPATVGVIPELEAPATLGAHGE